MSGADSDSDLLCVRLGAHTIRVSVRGTDGLPLLLVNGIGAGLETWEPLRAALGAQRTIAFDAPGTGGSSTPRRPLTMLELAHIALETVAQVGYEEVDVLGYSFGGAVAQEMAMAAPGRVRRLVLAATNCGWGSPLGDPLAVMTASAAGALLPPRPNPMGYWWQLLAISTWSSFAWISRVQQPTLVLAGSRDRVAPVAAARVLARELPNAELAVMAGEHWFLIGDGARETVERIAEFLASDQSPGASPTSRAVCT